jgi:hypothetical protein
MWYSLRDQDPQGRPWNETAQSGLFFRGHDLEADRAKPIRQAFRFPFVAFTRDRGSRKHRQKGMFVWGRTSGSKGGWVALHRKQGGKWRRLGRVKANHRGLFQGFVRIRAGSNRVGMVMATYRREHSAPFSLKPVRDRPARPFG